MGKSGVGLEVSMMKIKFYISFLLMISLSCSHRKDDDTQSVNTASKEDLKSVSIENLYERASTAYDLMIYNESVFYLTEIIRRDSTQGKAYFRIAKTFAAMKKYDSSKINYEKSISLDFQVASCFYNIGCNYMFANDDTLAIMYFKKSLKIDPNHEKAKINLERLQKGRYVPKSLI